MEVQRPTSSRPGSSRGSSRALGPAALALSKGGDKEVAALLGDLGLSEYAERLIVEVGCDSLDMLKELEEPDLHFLKPMHRKKLLRKVAELQASPVDTNANHPSTAQPSSTSPLQPQPAPSVPRRQQRRGGRADGRHQGAGRMDDGVNEANQAAGIQMLLEYQPTDITPVDFLLEMQDWGIFPVVCVEQLMRDCSEMAVAKRSALRQLGLRTNLGQVLHSMQIWFGGTLGVLSFECVLSRREPLRMYLRMYFFGIARGHNGPRAISKLMNWVPIVLCS